MNMATMHHRFFYPPGGILLWIIVFLEVVTFGIALVTMAFYAREMPEVFHTSRLQLQPIWGAINTVVLLTSGYFMARSIAEFERGQSGPAQRSLRIVLFLGAIFLLIKSLEYQSKLALGFTLGANLFFTFYWLLTGFHLLHVLVGMVILGIIGRNIHAKPSGDHLENLRSGGVFWHMCDLIWLLVFPVVYLLF